MTRDDVELLGLPATNTTKLRYEDGVDYGLWRYHPPTSGEPSGRFTDGHDHGMHGPLGVPADGWSVDCDSVLLPADVLLATLRALERAGRDLSAVATQRTKADRIGLAAVVRRRLWVVQTKIAQAVSPHGQEVER